MYVYIYTRVHTCMRIYMYTHTYRCVYVRIKKHICKVTQKGKNVTYHMHGFENLCTYMRMEIYTYIRRPLQRSCVLERFQIWESNAETLPLGSGSSLSPPPPLSSPPRP